MKKIEPSLKLLFLIASLAIFSAEAGYFSYITQVTELSKRDTRYDFVLEYWTENGNNPNPCQALGLLKGCYIQMNHFHKWPDEGGSNEARRMPWSCDVDLTHLKNMAEIREVAINQCGLTLPFTGSSVHSGSIKADECVAFFMTPHKRAKYGRMVPGGICGIAPPPAGKCAFRTNNLELSHGILDVESVNGNQTEGEFTFICNQNMPVKISSAMEEELLRLTSDGSIRSQVTINGASSIVGTVVDAIANEYMYVRVNSKLQTFGTPALGNFSGTTTFVLSIP